ncbi:MAG: hypothetical protein GX102_05495 [Porphyromonadaceae bacterium]|nr:hypothetical protein [Porphyromonadaceae bacterium]
MGKVKEFYHDEIEEQMRRELIEEPYPRPENDLNFVMSISAARIEDIHTVFNEIYQLIKSGYPEGSNTFPSKKEGTTSYGYRKL